MKTKLSFVFLTVLTTIIPSKSLLASNTGDIERTTKSMIKAREKTSERKEKLRVIMTSDFPP